MSDSDLWARITTLQMKLAAAEKQSAARREAMAELERERDEAREERDAEHRMREALADERDRFKSMHANASRERDALQAKLDDIEGAYRTVIDEKCASDEKHCTCVPHLRRRIAELEEVLRDAREAINLVADLGESADKHARKLLVHDGAGAVVTQAAFNALVAQRNGLRDRVTALEEQAKKDQQKIAELQGSTCPRRTTACHCLADTRSRAQCAERRIVELEAELREWKRGEHTHSQTRSARFIGQGNHDAGHP